MSSSSIDQYQMGLEIWDSKVVRELVKWFDNELWRKAESVDLETIRRLRRLWPSHELQTPFRRAKAKLPTWRGEVPQPALGPSQFTISATKQEIEDLLSQFRSNECKYSKDQESCAEFGSGIERNYIRSGKQLRSLWRRRASWGKKDLSELFDLAYINGRAAKMIKPKFIRQSPAKVVRSLSFLLEGPGDPFVRFEKVLADRSPYKLYGMGEVGVICLMHLWKPGEFGLFAKPVDNALNALVNFDRPVSLRKGQGFKDRTVAAKEIARRTGLNTFGRVDHFLDAIGNQHIGSSRLRRLLSR